MRRRHSLDVPVLSVGNLTTGGTGKTPLILWLVERLRSMGHKPGVLARGYGRREGAKLNDEGLLLRGRFPDLPQEQDPDRVAAGRRLQARTDVDCILLDDGFQHRRLRRDLDVVCLDAAKPFGRGGFLPAGDLREGPRSLARAGAVVLTRAGGVDLEKLRGRAEELRRMAGVSDASRLPVHFADHAPRDVVFQGDSDVESELELDEESEIAPTAPVAVLQGRPVVLLSGIARPEAFAGTVTGLGAEVVDHLVFRDHHWFRDHELEAATQRAQAAGALLLTTEKDEVRIATTQLASTLSRAVLRVDLSFLGDPLVWTGLELGTAGGEASSGTAPKDPS